MGSSVANIMAKECFLWSKNTYVHTYVRLVSILSHSIFTYQINRNAIVKIVVQSFVRYAKNSTIVCILRLPRLLVVPLFTNYYSERLRYHCCRCAHKIRAQNSTFMWRMVVPVPVPTHPQSHPHGCVWNRNRKIDMDARLWKCQVVWSEGYESRVPCSAFWMQNEHSSQLKNSRIWIPEFSETEKHELSRAELS